MRTFEEFLSESARLYGRGVNLFFEAGMYSLSTDLEPIVKALRDAGVTFELVGGVAVNAHIFGVDSSLSFVTRDIDVLIRRDWPRQSTCFLWASGPRQLSRRPIRSFTRKTGNSSESPFRWLP